VGTQVAAKNAEVFLGVQQGMELIKDEDIAILCDFDGTISTVQTMEFLYERFAACGMEYAYRWEAGEITTSEEIRSTFATVKSSKEEMERALEEIGIDEGFHGFLDFTEQNGFHVAIVSDGLEWYIDYLLKRNGISGIPIFANRIRFEGDGFRFDFPWFHKGTPMRGVSKPNIIKQYYDRGARVVYVGDGRTDIDVIGRVDLLYAKDWLAKYCKEQNIDAIEFTTWMDLLSKWREP
jgi:2-hydroxy-3-keto-5-methylthiopentenyl-1-phosphate phosphatase